MHEIKLGTTAFVTLELPRDRNRSEVYTHNHELERLTDVAVDELKYLRGKWLPLNVINGNDFAQKYILVSMGINKTWSNY